VTLGGEARPRILNIIPRLQLRGAEVAAQHLQNTLADRFEGRLVLLYGRREVPQPALLEGDGSLPFVRGVADGPGQAFRAAIRLRRLVGELRPDIVTVHGGEPLRVAVMAGLHRVAPLVYRRVASVTPDLRTSLRLLTLRYAYKRPTRFVAASEPLRHELISVFRVPERLIRVIGNGRPTPVPLTHLEHGAIRAGLSVRAADVMVTWVGRFVREKDPVAAVAVARRLQTLAPSTRVVMIGSGPLRERVLEHAAGLSNLTITEARADAPRVIAASDLLFSTSTTEGAPGVFVEAALAGVPVVSYDVGGIRDVVLPKQSGLLVPAGDLDALAGEVARVAGDEKERARMSAEASKWSARFEVREVAREWEALYREILKSSRRPAA
jgi:glycosyltransferase involved in cell wall biosynthesis